MPLIHSKSKPAFKKNVETLMGEVGKSPHVQSREQALAIAYETKRRGRAEGGALTEDDQAAMMPETYVNPVAKSMIEDAATLPRRAIESAANYRQTGDYDPAPVVEAALLPMGTGAIAGVPIRGGEAVLGSGMIRKVTTPNPTVIDAYHGTTKNFGEFQPSKSGEFGPGVYFADTPGMASYFGGREGNEGLNIIRANVHLENPFTVTKQQWMEMTKNKTPIEVQASLKKKGYDGIIGVGSNGTDKQIIPFETTSIKPRYGNDRAKGGPVNKALNIAYEAKRKARAEGGGVFQGPIVSEVPGRTDRHEMDVAAGSYVIPAEAVSHLGENNTLAGLKHLREMGPHGIRKLAMAAKGAHDIIRKHRLKRAVGGAAHEDETGHPVPVVTAGGEHVLSPEEVKIIGGGDVTLGHRLMDNWILQNRKHHIKTLSALEPPAKD